MRPGEIRDRLDTSHTKTVVVLSSETFNVMTGHAIVAPFQMTDKVYPGIQAEGGFIAFMILYSVPVSALSDSRGHVGTDAIEEAQALIAGAMTR
ncbi:MAG TPA: hypothetical protein VFU12_11365 [Glycomyces sp.]|nr:hypothetical protein [Glycomyces sp.]